jgi:hypothetical protein
MILDKMFLTFEAENERQNSGIIERAVWWIFLLISTQGFETYTQNCLFLLKKLSFKRSEK